MASAPSEPGGRNADYLRTLNGNLPLTLCDVNNAPDHTDEEQCQNQQSLDTRVAAQFESLAERREELLDYLRQEYRLVTA